VKATAHDLGLAGWVRNTEDGGVEAVLQGEEDAIHKLIDLCKKGPFLSEVKQVWFEWEDIGESFSEFEIRN
jgi:acylphosphatase